MKDIKFVIEPVPGHLYPDVIEHGGLANALQATLGELRSPLVISESSAAPVSVRLGRWADCVLVFIAAERRLFCLAFWRRGVNVAVGRTANLSEAVQSIDTWLRSSCTCDEFAAKFHFVSVYDDALAYERGEEVEARWQELLAARLIQGLRTIIRAAAAEPRLRELFPFLSHFTLGFSRCTGYPFTRDTPAIFTVGPNQFTVMSPAGQTLGRGNAEQAVAIAVSGLPPGCGRAVRGTADDIPELNG
jgi:Family of unknown function (DUF6193)